MTQQHTTRGPLALLVARLASLPEGEHLVVIDTRIPHRPRWRIAPLGEWEAPKKIEHKQEENSSNG